MRKRRLGSAARQVEKRVARATLIVAALVLSGAAIAQAAVPPAVTVGPASSVTSTSAQLNGTVDSQGEAGAEYRFEYRPTGAGSWKATFTEAAPTGSGPQPVAAEVNGLEPNLRYEYRLVGLQGELTETSAVENFTTAAAAPTVATGKAVEIGTESAVLTGTVDPHGTSTNFYFEYGTTTGYGGRAPAGEAASAGAGHGPRPVTRTITGLAPGQTYHFRLVAQSGVGPATGSDASFATLAQAETPRAYEQVTPTDQEGGIVDSALGFQVAPDGDGVSYMSRQAPRSVSSQPYFSRLMSVRGSTDWLGGTPLDPPLYFHGEDYFQLATLGLSEDFTYEFAVTNVALAPGAVSGDLNLYRIDVATKAAELVATSSNPEGLHYFTALGATNRFVGGGPNFEWIDFVSQVPLVAGAPESVLGAPEAALYHWSVGEGLRLESVLPDGSPANVEVQGQNGVRRMTSADGSTVYFGVFGGGVYERQGGVTKPVSVAAAEPSVVKGAVLQEVTKNGRFAFLSSGEPLTPDGPPPGFSGMYRYDLTTGTLLYLGQTENQYAALLGISESGDTAYFRSPGGFRVWRRGEAHLIQPPFSQQVIRGSAFVSPDGRYLAFQTTAAPLSEPAQVEFYDAETQVLTCVSCVPGVSVGTGELPTPERVVSNQIGQAVDDQGDVFFSSTDRLIPSDTNETRDVYRWRNGNLSLITPGNGPYESHIVGIAEEGRDVFFTTTQPLVKRDDNQSFDIYDAREGGGLPAQDAEAAPTCSGESCQGTTAVGPTPSSPTSEGVVGKSVKKRAPRCRKPKSRHGHKGKARCSKARPGRHGKSKHGSNAKHGGKGR